MRFIFRSTYKSEHECRIHAIVLQVSSLIERPTWDGSDDVTGEGWRLSRGRIWEVERAELMLRKSREGLQSAVSGLPG